MKLFYPFIVLTKIRVLLKWSLFLILVVFWLSYVFFFFKKFDENFYVEILKNKSIFEHRIENGQIFYPIDFFVCNNAGTSQKEKLAFILTLFALALALTIYPFYLVLFFILFYSNVFYILYSIVWYKILKKKIIFSLNRDNYNQFNIDLKKILYFILVQKPLDHGFLLVHYILKKQKPNKIHTLKIIFFSKIFNFPICFFKLSYSIFKLFLFALSSTDWSRKKKKFWIRIFFQELNSHVSFQINYYYSSFFLDIEKKRIMVLKGRCVLNGKHKKIAADFVTKQALDIINPSQSEFIQNTLTSYTPHRVALYTKNIISLNSDKKLIVESFTTKKSIRLDNDNKCIRIHTEKIGQNQHSFTTLLPTKIFEKKILKSFFQNQDITNFQKYTLFKICENAKLIQKSERIKSNDITIIDEFSKIKQTTYSDLKKTNNLSIDNQEFIENTSVQLFKELENFIYIQNLKNYNKSIVRIREDAWKMEPIIGQDAVIKIIDEEAIKLKEKLKLENSFIKEDAEQVLGIIADSAYNFESRKDLFFIGLVDQETNSDLRKLIIKDYDKYFDFNFFDK